MEENDLCPLQRMVQCSFYVFMHLPNLKKKTFQTTTLQNQRVKAAPSSHHRPPEAATLFLIPFLSMSVKSVNRIPTAGVPGGPQLCHLEARLLCFHRSRLNLRESPGTLLLRHESPNSEWAEFLKWLINSDITLRRISHSIEHLSAPDALMEFVGCYHRQEVEIWY